MKHLFKLLLGSLILALVVSATSCGSAAKLRKATATFDAHGKEAAQYCATRYPVKPFTKTVVKTIKGKPDTVAVPGETVYADCSEEVIAALDQASRKHVPVKTTVKIVHTTDTLIVHDTTVAENTAVTEGLHYYADSLSNAVLVQSLRANKAEASSKSRLHWCFGLGALCLLLLGFLTLIFTGKIR